MPPHCRAFGHPSFLDSAGVVVGLLPILCYASPFAGCDLTLQAGASFDSIATDDYLIATDYHLMTI